jgi:hypothetical protein
MSGERRVVRLDEGRKILDGRAEAILWELRGEGWSADELDGILMGACALALERRRLAPPKAEGVR